MNIFNNKQIRGQKCIESIFPFNRIENDLDFVEASVSDEIDYIFDNQNLLFQPFEDYEEENYLPLNDIDPDLNLYNEMNLHIGSRCSYFLEHSFKSKVSSMDIEGNMFSLCHMNIRSMKKNLYKLDAYLDTLDYTFTVIGLSETWLQDSNCDVYGIQGYSCIENHRQNKSGGGVGILLKNSISFFQKI